MLVVVLLEVNVSVCWWELEVQFLFGIDLLIWLDDYSVGVHGVLGIIYVLLDWFVVLVEFGGFLIVMSSVDLFD